MAGVHQALGQLDHCQANCAEKGQEDTGLSWKDLGSLIWDRFCEKEKLWDRDDMDILSSLGVCGSLG